VSGETIFVVDDEDNVREMIGSYLKEAGYRPILAHDGQEALAQIELREPDLVLADVNMPNLNGLQLAERLRANPDTAGVPILLLSALSQPREILSGYSVGADEYVTKPVELAVLLAKIEVLLARRPPRSVGVSAGMLVAFLHAKGGVGTTTLAVNVAVALASSLGPARVCLVDLHPFPGSAASLLGLAPPTSLGEAPGSGAEPTDEMVDQQLLTHASGIRLLPGMGRGQEEAPAGGRPIRGLVDRLRDRFDYVIADLPVGLEGLGAELAALADVACVVTTVGRASVTVTRALLRRLDAVPVPVERQMVIVVRLAAGLELAQVIQILQREPVALIQSNDLHPYAADVGEPVVSTYGGHRVAIELEHLAGTLKRALASEAVGPPGGG
jgi:pilus assembly protein CpaE